jgi:hypothetical protein
MFRKKDKKSVPHGTSNELQKILISASEKTGETNAEPSASAFDELVKSLATSLIEKKITEMQADPSASTNSSTMDLSGPVVHDEPSSRRESIHSRRDSTSSKKSFLWSRTSSTKSKKESEKPENVPAADSALIGMMKSLGSGLNKETGGDTRSDTSSVKSYSSSSEKNDDIFEVNNKELSEEEFRGNTVAQLIKGLNLNKEKSIDTRSDTSSMKSFNSISENKTEKLKPETIPDMNSGLPRADDLAPNALLLPVVVDDPYLQDANRLIEETESGNSEIELQPDLETKQRIEDENNFQERLLNLQDELEKERLEKLKELEEQSRIKREEYRRKLLEDEEKWKNDMKEKMEADLRRWEEFKRTEEKILEQQQVEDNKLASDIERKARIVQEEKIRLENIAREEERLERKRKEDEANWEREFQARLALEEEKLQELKKQREAHAQLELSLLGRRLLREESQWSQELEAKKKEAEGKWREKKRELEENDRIEREQLDRKLREMEEKLAAKRKAKDEEIERLRIQDIQEEAKTEEEEQQREEKERSNLARLDSDERLENLQVSLEIKIEEIMSKNLSSLVSNDMLKNKYTNAPVQLPSNLPQAVQDMIKDRVSAIVDEKVPQLFIKKKDESRLVTSRTSFMLISNLVAFLFVYFIF